jgi:PRTRC genetic system protein B
MTQTNSSSTSSLTPKKSRKKTTKLLLPKYKWELPEDLEVPRDELAARLDVYSESIVLYLMEKGAVTTRVISADNLAAALLRHATLNSGILPEGALWWKMSSNGPEIALWRPPKVWKVALQEEAFKPARRFDLPMPGLIFLCTPGRPPSVFAAKTKPKLPSTQIFHAPLFNTYDNGTTCPGTNKYPDKITEIPENFFTCFFTKTTWGKERSQKHGRDLLALWEEIDGKPYYPAADLVRAGTVADLLDGGKH